MIRSSFARRPSAPSGPPARRPVQGPASRSAVLPSDRRSMGVWEGRPMTLLGCSLHPESPPTSVGPATPARAASFPCADDHGRLARAGRDRTRIAQYRMRLRYARRAKASRTRRRSRSRSRSNVVASVSARHSAPAESARQESQIIGGSGFWSAATMHPARQAVQACMHVRRARGQKPQALASPSQAGFRVYSNQAIARRGTFPPPR